MQKRIYLAGPEVFLQDSVEAGRRKRELCAKFGFLGHYPLDNVLEEGDQSLPMSKRIFDANVELMKSCDMAVANLTPFRGPSADAGTVFEVGFMHAAGKPVFGYSNMSGDYLSQARRFTGVAARASGKHYDQDGMEVEDFGLADNLMIAHALAGFVAADPDAALSSSPLDIWRDLAGFEACLQMAAAYGI